MSHSLPFHRMHLPWLVTIYSHFTPISKGNNSNIIGPSYKRGPPKGYIHAIEQRWHQVEALLGSILQCPDPRVQSIVSDLRQDDLAREILGRVDSGPYVSLEIALPFLHP